MTHPARYTKSLLPVFARMLRDRAKILDPFGGTGERLNELAALLPGARLFGVEIEREWITGAGMVNANALYLPFASASFDAIVTSPTYGNRMADHHEARDASQRNTYRHRLGRPLAADNSGAMQWGEEYQRFHILAWREALRVLKPGGVFVLNVKDHIRAGVRQEVTAWHITTLCALGLVNTGDVEQIEASGNRQGRNGSARIGYECVVKLEKM